METTSVNFQKIRNKTVGVAHKGTHCPFESNLVQNATNVSKINLTIISNHYAHVQGMVETTVKFKKNRNKTAGRFENTRYPLSILLSKCPKNE